MTSAQRDALAERIAVAIDEHVYAVLDAQLHETGQRQVALTRAALKDAIYRALGRST